MLTDVALKNLKPRAKPFKVADRDGMYAHVSTSGLVTFRLDYRLNGRRETVMLGRYSRDGLSLALARERCIDARRAVNDGRSPALEKQREKRRLRQAKSFGGFAETWFSKAPMADSTRAMRRAIYDRDIGPQWRNRLLTELLPDDLRAHCSRIVDRGAPATAIHVRDIVKQIFGFATLHGEKVANPADQVGPAAIATFVPRDRSLSPAEIRVMLKQLDHVATLPTIRLGMRLFLLTMMRKSELQDTNRPRVGEVADPGPHSPEQLRNQANETAFHFACAEVVDERLPRAPLLGYVVEHRKEDDALHVDIGAAGSAYDVLELTDLYALAAAVERMHDHGRRRQVQSLREGRRGNSDFENILAQQPLDFLAIVDADEGRARLDIGEHPRRPAGLGVKRDAQPPGDAAPAAIIERAALTQELDADTLGGRIGLNVIVEVEIVANRSAERRRPALLKQDDDDVEALARVAQCEQRARQGLG